MAITMPQYEQEPKHGPHVKFWFILTEINGGFMTID
jgi:hypothetical protein